MCCENSFCAAAAVAFDAELDAYYDSLCPVCYERPWSRHYDRNGIYSGRACHECKHTLPGQGAMWHYQAEEPIDEEPLVGAQERWDEDNNPTTNPVNAIEDADDAYWDGPPSIMGYYE